MNHNNIMNPPDPYFTRVGPPNSPPPNFGTNRRAISNEIQITAHTEYVTTLVARDPVGVLNGFP